MLAFLLSAAIVGGVVVFFLPFVKSQIDKSEQLKTWTANRWIQMVVVGAIVLVGIMVFVAVARQLKIPVKA